MNPDLTASQPVSREGAKGNLASISPFFIVKDLQTSISHYLERFGFELDFQGPPDEVLCPREPGRDRHHAQGNPP